MKKWLIGIILFLLFLTLTTYLLLPSQTVVKQTTLVNASAKSSYRCLTEKNMIQKWLNTDKKGHESTNNTSVTAKEWQYLFTPLVFNGVKVNMQNGNKDIESVIVINALDKDSSFLEWKAEWPQTYNPFLRLQHYWMAQQVKKNMFKTLHQFSDFINSPEKIYGLQIKRAKVTDTIIITTKKIFNKYPTTENYYPMIESLQQYISQAGVQATNYPMLNISSIGAKEYGVMVGIPINRAVQEKNGIQIKRMIPGNILVAEVTGGTHRIEGAMNEMHNFIQENNLLPPAIPYQSLVTNRKAEPDTSRWVTKLYFPVY